MLLLVVVCPSMWAMALLIGAMLLKVLIRAFMLMYRFLANIFLLKLASCLGICKHHEFKPDW